MIIIGTDHAGYKLKEKIKKYLEKKYTLIDVGNYTLEKKDDYPDYALRLGENVVEKKAKGILFCGSAEGMSIAANKIKGIRAVAVNTVALAKKSREHNNANVLCLSGWYLNETKAKKIINAWLQTKFSSSKRHQRRVNKIKRIERKYFR
jgi:RpiB/LacA/LacB family sugar-phosphate isomerase